MLARRGAATREAVAGLNIVVRGCVKCKEEERERELVVVGSEVVYVEKALCYSGVVLICRGQSSSRLRWLARVQVA